MLVTITQVAASGNNMKIKFADDYSVPDELLDGPLFDTRSWEVNIDTHLLEWTDDGDNRLSLIFPPGSVQWIICSRTTPVSGDHFKIPGEATVASGI